MSAVPLVHFLILFVGRAFWSELVDNVGWMLVITNLGLSLIVMLALVQAQCSFAKHWVEESVFSKGGERFPTTNMLLYAEGLISSKRKELLRRKISATFDCSFASEEEEANNPADARLQAGL